MKHIKKIIGLVVAITSLIIAVHEEFVTTIQSQQSAVETEVVAVPLGYVLVDRVVDGDTFEITLEGKKEKVRMIGIDTPESVDPRRPVQCFGKEATKKLEELIGSKPVRLDTDPKGDTSDKYNRLLRYVYIEDGTHINAKMIEEGYAFAYTQFSFQNRVEFLKLQTAARDAGRGLWAQSTCRGRR